MDKLDDARRDLRRRQGGGARYDAARAPARDLDWARRGTAYFARLLNDLSDVELDAPSALTGYARREIVAHIGYHARALGAVAAWARSGAGGVMPGSLLVDLAEVRRRSTQPARALRNLFAHSTIHINVEWRDLEDRQWEADVRDQAGMALSVDQTPWRRARAIWLHAVDLGAGGRLVDAPPDFVAALIAEQTPEETGDRSAAGPPMQAARIALHLSGRGPCPSGFKAPSQPPSAPVLFNL